MHRDVLEGLEFVHAKNTTTSDVGEDDVAISSVTRPNRTVHIGKHDIESVMREIFEGAKEMRTRACHGAIRHASVEASQTGKLVLVLLGKDQANDHVVARHLVQSALRWVVEAGVPNIVR